MLRSRFVARTLKTVFCIVTLQTTASSTDLLLTMCNFKYYPGAVNLLISAREHGNWHGEIAVLVTSDVPTCARKTFNDLDVHVLNISEQWVNKQYPDHRTRQTWTTTVHFGKFDILTTVFFRRFERVIYADSDMKVLQPIDPLLASIAQMPAAYVRVGKPDAMLYREAHHPIPPTIAQRFPDRQRVHSTRLMMFNMGLLPDSRTMATEIEELLTDVGCYFNVMYEQGVLQLLFYTKLGDLPASEIKTYFQHYYSSALPWLPGHPDFSHFALWFEGVTQDSICFKNAVFDVGG